MIDSIHLCNGDGWWWRMIMMMIVMIISIMMMLIVMIDGTISGAAFSYAYTSGDYFE